MAFLIKQDIEDLVRSDVLDQLTEDNDKLWNRVLNTAIEEVKIYLRHYYDADLATKDLIEFNLTTAFVVDDWVTDYTDIWVCVQDSTGNTITNTAYFEESDPRNPKLKDLVIDILLYHLHSRTSANQIPEHRTIRYEQAISLLKMIQKGSVQMELPLKETSTDGDQENYSWSYGEADRAIDKNYSV